LVDPEPLGGPGTAPPPDPALFGTYSTAQDLKGTIKRKPRPKAKGKSRPKAKKSSK
jgi:Mn-containing catalase